VNQQYPHDPNQPFQPQQPFPAQHQAPKQSHRVRNVIGGVAAGIVTLIFIIGFFTDDPSTSAASNTPLPNVVTTDEPAAVKSTQPAAPKTTAPKPTATEGTGCDLNSSPEEYSDCLDRFVNGTTATPKPTKIAPKLTAGQEQAIGSAESYLGFTAFSRKGLIRQLSSDAGEGFSVADATYAVGHIKVDWNEQAAKSAKSYLEMTHFSRQGLIQQLESSAGDGFTHRQAVYGVTKAGL
jgi:hypothetical protein